MLFGAGYRGKYIVPANFGCGGSCVGAVGSFV